MSKDSNVPGLLFANIIQTVNGLVLKVNNNPDARRKLLPLKTMIDVNER